MLVYTAGSYVVLPAECCIQLENTDINLEVSNMVFFLISGLLVTIGTRHKIDQFYSKIVLSFNFRK